MGRGNGWVILAMLSLLGGCVVQDAPEGVGPEAEPAWMATAQRRIADAEYQVVEGEAGLSFGNRAQNLRAYFVEGGVRVDERDSGSGPLSEGLGSFAVTMTTMAWGRAGDLRAADLGSAAAGECDGTERLDVEGSCLRRVERQGDGLVEWWANREDGIEQGWTIAGRPWGVGPLIIEVGVEGARVEEDGDGVVLSAGTNRLRYGGVRAWDAEGRVLAARIEGLRVEVEDEGALYPVTVDPLLTSAAWTAESNQSGADFGWSVSSAGDTNGDGYGDVVVGAGLFDNGEDNEGRAFLYLGSASGLSASAAWTAESNQASAQFGISVSFAGDTNGDGYGDVVVGAPLFDNGEGEEGRAFLYLGSASGLSASTAWTAESNQGNAYFGFSVSSAGDTNGDGFGDVVVGARAFDNGEGDEGRSFLYLGSASGLSASAAWTAESNQGGAYFGYSVSSAGDVNGDGYGDVVVGAYGFDNGESDEGAAFLYLGSASGLSASAAWTTESDQASAAFGWSVFSAGDTNGDGYGDVVVGAPYYDNGYGYGEGRAFLYLGSASGLSGTAAWTDESDQASAVFGYSVSSAGDVNGDGYGDVIVGALGFDNGETDEGRAFLYLGLASGLSASAAWTAESNQASAQFGSSVSSAGDVNGDGYGDVVVGAYLFDNVESNEGRAFLYYGSPSVLAPAAAWTAESDQTTASFGWSVSSAGDVNGDGYSDVVVGAQAFDNGESNEGRAFLYLGSASGLSASAAWTAESNQAGAEFGRSVSSAGDTNGDGYGDVVVGAFLFDNGQTNEGAAFLYLGSASGLSASAAWTAESNQTGAGFGYSVSSAGDTDGDGYGDVIVGAYGFDNGESNEGRAFLYLGSASGLSAAATWTAESNQAGAELGLSVSSAGDTNGDGYGDVVVGAYWFDNGETREGRAFLYLGSASGLAASAAWTAESNQLGAEFGFSVSSAGDTNGDGYGDVVVGAVLFDNGETDEGRALLYLGSASGLSASAAWTAESNQATAYFGYSVSSAGDVNGDGYGDLVVGAWSFTNGETDEGRAFLYLGSAGGPSASAAWTAESNQANARFGHSVSSAGDVNGDGYGDVLVGASYYDNGQPDEGRAFLYLGNGGDSTGLHPAPAALRAVRPSTTTPIAPGLRSAVAGSFGVTGLARSPFGRTQAKLQVESKPLGTPFDGIGFVTSPTWTDTGTSGAQIAQTVSSLVPTQGEHWRARWLYDPADGAPQGWSPWSWGGLSGDPLGTHVVPDDYDEDDDGFPPPADCDDTDPTVFPGAPEIAGDEIDQDCDGIENACFADSDGDGYRTAATQPNTDLTCTDSGEALATDPSGDCDDAVDTIYPGAPESCDAIDSDCNGSLVDSFTDTDADLDPDCTDLDDDGDGDPDANDCADLDAAVYTGAPETPDDGIDQDCNGADTVTCFVDGDGDGFGSAATLLAPDGDCADSGESSLGTDCNDTSVSVYPGAAESCDSIDSNCDGSLVDGFPNFDNDALPDCIDLDDDNDADPDASDCDDANASVFTGATESCDSIDSDCDGSLVDSFPNFDGDTQPDCIDLDDDNDGDPDTSDCDDTNASVFTGATEACDAVDSDCNGSLVDGFTDTDSDLDPDCTDPDDDNDGDPDTTDCADLDASLYTGAAEIADDGIDQDCNGADTVTCFLDGDGDTFGSTATLLAGDGDCADAGESTLSTDCDDSSATVYPGAPESCDAIDSDCDTDLVDSFIDTDGDLDPDCTDPDDDDDGSPDTVDCGPLDDAVFPNATESCDAVDSNCDGDIVDGFADTDGDGIPDCVDIDLDGDTYDASVDCDDSDPALYPGAPEIADDGIDQDCNGTDTVTCFEDLDGDTFGSTTLLAADGDCTDDPGETDNADDCDDAAADIYPGATESCDTLDSDCDGDLVDEFTDSDGDGTPDCIEDDLDGDGHAAGADCDDEDPATYPGADELCDGLDNDCDDAVPDDELDGDADGFAPCDGDCDDGEPNAWPAAPELCDGLDNDCDDAIDEEIEAVDWFADADGDGWGDPDAPWQDNPDCAAPQGHVQAERAFDCDDAEPAVNPDAVEVCNGIDDDCDPTTQPESGPDEDDDGDGWLACVASDDRAADCDDASPATSPGAAEVCSGDRDEDCDGLVDGDDPECAGVACTNCGGSVAGREGEPYEWGVVLLLAGLTTRRKRWGATR